jgi:hypothetical protein
MHQPGRKMITLNMVYIAIKLGRKDDVLRLPDAKEFAAEMAGAPRVYWDTLAGAGLPFLDDDRLHFPAGSVPGTSPSSAAAPAGRHSPDCSRSVSSEITLKGIINGSCPMYSG